MADGNFKIEESDFEDAIIEIANEIDLINAIKRAEPKRSDPKIVLKVEMELKTVKSSSTNIFKILKMIQEIQIHSGSVHTNTQATPSTIERKYFPLKKGLDQKYHPLTITETIMVSKDISDCQNLTIEDLFEEPESMEKLSVLLSSKNKIRETNLVIPDSDDKHQLESGSKIPDKEMIKTVNIPNTITKNITLQLKEKERELFQNLMKMQKR